MKCVLILMVFASIATTTYGQLHCSDWLQRKPMKYHPLRHCQRSNEYQIGSKNVANLEKCAEFAENNFALAFNFGHGRKPKNESADHNLINLFDKLPANRSAVDESDQTPYVNCEILACPEIGNLSTMDNDTRYNYYTLYANPIPPANATCLPSIGLFIYSYERSHNYSEAEAECTQHGAIMADVLSESRTNYLSSLVLQYSSNTTINAVDFEITSNGSHSIPVNIPMRHAFIGLKETERNGKFVSSQLKPIECFRYRAWEPRFPSKSKKLGCVAITDASTWKMFDCRKRMPFICEIYPSGPSKLPVNLNRKCSLKRPNNVL